MSVIDQGKEAKRQGRIAPRVARRLDPVPPRPTPGTRKKKRPAKTYGFTYEVAWFGEDRWTTRVSRFATERARDQAMNALRRKGYSFYRNIQPVP